MERTRMAIVVVGLNHTTAPVAVRERLAFSDATLAQALAQFRPPEVQELVILSTCNRVEMYMQTCDVDASVASCVAFIAACHAVPAPQFTAHLYQWSDLEAVRHLFRVAASLDSLVLGEPQILGQVKEAYLAAQGAGDTAELAARHLVNQGVARMFIANRTSEGAVHLAQALQAKAIPWEAFPEHLVYTDIVLSSTSAPHPILHPAMVREAIRARRSRPMFLIDIAVPRDVDPAVNTLENVFLYDIDDLHNVVQENRRERQREALAAEELVWQEVRQFEQWFAVRDAVPTIVALRQHAEAIRRQELDKALHKCGPLDERQRRVLEALTCGIVNKLLHAPTVSLKRASQEGQVRDAVHMVRHLFNLDA
jgi:glutamyl-tRNA reductase